MVFEQHIAFLAVTRVDELGSGQLQFQLQIAWIGPSQDHEGFIRGTDVRRNRAPGQDRVELVLAGRTWCAN